MTGLRSRSRRCAAHWLRAAGAVLALLGGATTARGDGGLLRLNESAGPFEISVFTAPTPLRVGPADVSVMVLATVGRAPILDADVQVALRLGALARSASATHAGATNKLLYAAWLDIPEPGAWALDVRVQSAAGSAALSSTLDVAPPLSPLVAFWPYLALPGLAVALFAAHQWLKRSGGEAA